MKAIKENGCELKSLLPESFETTYIFEPVLAYLTMNGQKPDEREPDTPPDYLIHFLQVQYAEYENKL